MFLAFLQMTTALSTKHLSRYFRYALANVDSRVTHLQIKAILNIGEGEREYTERKVGQVSWEGMA